MIKKGVFGEYVIGGIYTHYKGGYYKIVDVAFLNNSQNIFLIIYNKCDINGVYISIRDKEGNPEVHQPFATHETRWHEIVTNSDGNKVPRFKLI
jgi:hypothetical protein